MYDAIIIGAGIGGLVCGCYLAKAGMKVLVAEQHNKPGGYCTSFRRKNFVFDAAAHCFGGYRSGGIVRKVFDELAIDKKINIIRFDPSDTIITPDCTVHFWNTVDKTIEELQNHFPEESTAIKNFFYFLLNPDPNSFTRIRSWTFKNLLDQFLMNDKLKAILSIPLLGNGGLPPSLMSAFIGAKLFSEFLIDGGYYPEGGMQKLPDAMADILREFGGELRLSSLVKKIKMKDNKILGIVTEKDGFIPSKYVVSDCDARQTFYTLLGGENISEEFLDRLNAMIPSNSVFALYLGIDGNLQSLPESGTSLWFLSHYDLEKAHRAAIAGDIHGFGGYMLRVSPDKSTLLALIPAPFENENYWVNKKESFSETFFDAIEKNSIPELSSHILYREAASPYTLFRYTLNYKGASYGWAVFPSQLAIPDFRKPSFIQGLYLTGHWSTLGIGISGVVYVGHDTAKLILRKVSGRI